MAKAPTHDVLSRRFLFCPARTGSPYGVSFLSDSMAVRARQGSEEAAAVFRAGTAAGSPSRPSDSAAARGTSSGYFSLDRAEIKACGPARLPISPNALDS